MRSVQSIHEELTLKKKEARVLRNGIKQEFDATAELVEIKEKIKTLREKKKQIEAAVRARVATELQQLEDKTMDIKALEELLTDASLSTLMKGETVEVTDEYHNVYDPKFKVKFIKS